MAGPRRVRSAVVGSTEPAAVGAITERPDGNT